MQAVVIPFRDAVVQIATPYNKEGTGFYLKQYNIIVTNEHVVRENSTVAIEGHLFSKMLTTVLYLDQKYDLAFLQVPSGLDLPALTLKSDPLPKEGDQIIAIGHPFGMKFTMTQGFIAQQTTQQDTVMYLLHDAAMHPGNSGGPLIDLQGSIIGVNTFILKDGHPIGLALPAYLLETTIKAFLLGNGDKGVRCHSCSNIIFEQQRTNKYCPVCGAYLLQIADIEAYEPYGVAKTIEEILSKNNYQVELARCGLNSWEVQRGSAKIIINYHEDSGLIMGDAYLCLLPKTNAQAIYEFLLHQNMILEGLTLSVNPMGQDIILSLLIFDRDLNVTTGVALFQRLFEGADHYDNVLVEEYGATWKESTN